MKKFLIALCLLMGYATLHAATAVVNGIEWTYQVSNGEAQIYKGARSPAIPASTSGAIIIPATLGGYRVTSIGGYAFYNCSSLTSVTIPESVTSIGDNAFGGCSGLTSVTIPSSVTSIGSSAFSDCIGLTSVTIPEGVTITTSSIVEVSNGTWSAIDVSDIGYSHGYRSPTIGHSSSTSMSIKVVGPTDFSFKWKVSSESGYDYLRWYLDGTQKNSISGTGGDWQTVNCSIPEGEHTIQWTYSKDYSVTSGSDCGWVAFNGASVIDAFAGCSNLKGVTLPCNTTTPLSNLFPNAYTTLERVTLTGESETIAENLFSGCASLQVINIPDGVTSIGDDAFRGCSSLTSVTIPSGVTSIGSSAFRGCSGLTSVTIPSSAISIGSNAFNGVAPTTLTAAWLPNGMSKDNLKTLIIPEGVTSIKSSAFYNCSSLTSVTIPESVTTIGSSAFYNCSSLTSVTIPSSVTSIGNYAFSGCSSLTSFVVDSANQHYSTENGLLCSKDGKTLVACPGGLTSVTIPSSVTSIGDNAFGGCSGLTSVTIPSSVTSIGSSAFSDCIGLTSVTIPEGVTITTSSIVEVSNGTWSAIDVSDIGYSHGYRSPTIGHSSSTSMSIKVVGPTDFSFKWKVSSESGYDYLRWYLDGMQKNAISGTGGDWQMVSCSIPDGEHTIQWTYSKDSYTASGSDCGWVAFNGGSVIATFAGCSNLKEVTLPCNTTTPLSKFFPDAYATLECVTLTGESETIAENLFAGCALLQAIEIPHGVTSIKDNAFSGCSSLTSVTIPSSVTSIGDYAFEGNISITFNGSLECSKWPLGLNKSTKASVTIPEGVTSIGSSAFSGCSNLTSVTIPSSVTEIASNAFSGCSALEHVSLPIGLFDGTVNYSLDEDLDNLEGWTLSDGVYRSKSIGNSSSTSMSLTIEGPYTFSFDWQVSSESGCDYLSWYLDGTQKTSISGTGNGWRTVTHNVPEGTHTITWTYSKNYNYYNGSDCGWVRLPECGVTSMRMATLFPDAYSTIKEVEFVGEGEAIRSGAFSGCAALEAIEIPEGVTTIGSNAFSGCSGLTSVTIPSSVTEIASNAFSGCNALERVSLPIGLFDGKVNYSLDNDLVNSDGWTLSEGVYRSKAIGNYGSTSLSLTVEGLCEFTFDWQVSSESGSDYLKWSLNGTQQASISGTGDGWRTVTRDLPEGTHTITWTYSKNYSYYSGSDCGWVRLPDAVSTSMRMSKLFPDAYATIKEVEFVGEGDAIQYAAFSGCSALEAIEIPEGVTHIGERAFKDCSALTSVTIPSSVTSIGSSAFLGCSGLTSVTIPSSVISIGSSAFYGCSGLTSVTIPEGVNTIERGVFSGCSGLTSVTIPMSVTLIGASAFSGCSGLTSLTIPSSVTSIGSSAFAGCSGLTSVTIPLSVTEIGDSAFEGVAPTTLTAAWSPSGMLKDNLETVVIPEGVTAIRDQAFNDCNALISLTIPNGVTKIGSNAFSGCSGLTSVTIPSSVISIGSSAFYGCSGLTSVTIPSSVTEIGDSAFEGVAPTTLTAAWLPSGMSKDNLKTVIIPEGVTAIRDQAFYDCAALTSVTIPNGVTLIDASAFYGCSKLASVIIPSSVKELGDSAFKHCAALESVVIAEGLETIGSDAFGYCNKVAKFTLPTTVSKIGYRVFTGCHDVEVKQGNAHYESVDGILFTKSKTYDGVHIDDNVWLLHFPITRAGTYIVPEHVHTIGDEAFAGNVKIEEVVLPAVTVIRPAAFMGCSALKYCFAMDGLLRVQAEAFAEATALTTFTMPASVERLEWAAFRNCSSLAIVAFKGNPPAIDSASGVGVYQVFTGMDYDHQVGGLYPNALAGTWHAAFANSGMWDGLRMNPAENYINTSKTEDFHYRVFDGEATITGTTKSLSGDVVIPRHLGGCLVTEIAPSALDKCGQVTSLFLPVGIQKLPSDVFINLKSLQSITVDVNNVEFMSYDGILYNDDGTKLISVPQMVTEVEILDSVTEIGTYAFAYCEKLEKVRIPQEVTTIGSLIFKGCKSSLDIVFLGSVPLSVADDAFERLTGFYLMEFARIWENAIENGIWKNLKMRELGPVTLTFKLGYGTDTVVTLYPGDDVEKPQNPVRTGYTFTGWSPTIPDKAPAQSTTYVAQWQVNQYTLTFNANGGTGGKTLKQNYGTKVTAPTVTRTGYTFIGWSPAAPATVPAKNVTYVAQWKANSSGGDTPSVVLYTITFNANGGTGGKTVKQAAGTTLTAPTVTRTGYTFTGWSPAVPAKTPAQNVTYTAQWKANSTTGDETLTKVDIALLSYTTKKDQATITGCKSSNSGWLDIPPKIGNATVVAIANGAFKGQKNLKKVTLPNTITSIGKDAFAGCSNLDVNAIVMPNQPKLKVGKGAFTGCKVTEVSAVPGEPLTSKQLGKAVGYKVATSVSGLKLNAKTGEITATFKKSGTYEAVLFTPGATLKALRIKVGAMPKLTIKMEGADTGCSVKGAGEYLMGKKVSLSAKASKEKIFLGFYDAQGKQLTSAMKYSYVMGRENVTLTAKFTVEQITIDTSALTSKTWKVGETVNVTIPVTAESGVKSVKAAKLPSGLKLSKTKDNCWQVTGSPKKVGNYTVTFTVGTIQKKQKTVTITMMVIAETVTINTSAVKNKTLNVGQAVRGLTIGASSTSGIKSVKASKLPSGMKVQLVNGVWQLTGAPKKAGTYTVTLTITTKANTKVTETFTLTVALIPEWAVKTYVGEVVNVWEDDDGEVETWGTAQVTLHATGEVEGNISLDDGLFASLSGTAKLLESSTNKVRLQVTVPWFDPDGKADGKVKTELIINNNNGTITLDYRDSTKDSYVTGRLNAVK